MPGSELAGVVIEVGRRRDDVAAGDRVFGTALVGAFAEEAVLAAATLTRDPRRRRRPHRGRVRCRPPHRVPRAPVGGRGCSRARSSSCSAPAVASGSRRSSSASCSARPVTAVASSAEKLDVAALATGATDSIDHRDGDLRQALREPLPDGADVVVDPVGGDLSEPALRSLRWGGRFVTVGYASGEIPRIPLNLVLLKGVQVLGFEFRDFATHCADEMPRNEARAARPAGVEGERRRTSARPSRSTTSAAALRHVADGRAIGKVVLDVG